VGPGKEIEVKEGDCIGIDDDSISFLLAQVLKRRDFNEVVECANTRVMDARFWASFVVQKRILTMLVFPNTSSSCSPIPASGGSPTNNDYSHLTAVIKDNQSHYTKITSCHCASSPFLRLPQ
jgi:hypothetical protein